MSDVYNVLSSTVCSAPVDSCLWLLLWSQYLMLGPPLFLLPSISPSIIVFWQKDRHLKLVKNTLPPAFMAWGSRPGDCQLCQRCSPTQTLLSFNLVTPTAWKLQNEKRQSCCCASNTCRFGWLVRLVAGAPPTMCSERGGRWCKQQRRGTQSTSQGRLSAKPTGMNAGP